MAQPSNTASAALFGTFAGIGNTKSSVPSLPFAGSGGTGASYFTMYGQVRNAVEQRRHTVDRFHIEPAGGEQTTHSGNAAEMSGAGGTDAPHVDDASCKDRAASPARRRPTMQNVFTEEEAVKVFLCRPTALGTRSLETASLARSLGERHGVTSKAIRDVWNRRSWAWATRPHWTQRELQEELQETLCDSCRARGVVRIEGACAICAEQGAEARCYRRRGRPAGAKDSYQRNRRSVKDAGGGFDAGHVESLAPAAAAVAGSPSRGTACVTGKIILCPKTLHIVQACDELKRLHAAAPIEFEGQSLLHWLHPHDARQVWLGVQARIDPTFPQDDSSEGPKHGRREQKLNVRMLQFRRRALLELLDFEWLPVTVRMQPRQTAGEAAGSMQVEISWRAAETSLTDTAIRGLDADISGVFRFVDLCSDMDMLGHLALLGHVSAARNVSVVHVEVDSQRLPSCLNGSDDVFGSPAAIFGIEEFTYALRCTRKVGMLSLIDVANMHAPAVRSEHFAQSFGRSPKG